MLYHVGLCFWRLLGHLSGTGFGTGAGVDVDVVIGVAACPGIGVMAWSWLWADGCRYLSFFHICGLFQIGLYTSWD